MSTNKEENVKIEPVDLAKEMGNHRPAFNRLGALCFGSKFFKVEPRAAIAGFAEKKKTIEQNGNVDFVLNRTPIRVLIKGFDIMHMDFVNDALGAAKVVLNKGETGEVSIPYKSSENGDAFSQVTEDALGKALRGDTSIIFSDAEKLANQVNSLNIEERKRLVSFRDELSKQIQSLDNAIKENNDKVKEYKAQLFRNDAEEENNHKVIITSSGTETAPGSQIVIVE